VVHRFGDGVASSPEADTVKLEVLDANSSLVKTPPAPFGLTGSRNFNLATNAQPAIMLSNIESLPA